MISIVQNFVCTKDERLHILERELPKIGEVFGECDFYVNYNTQINADKVYDLYRKHIPKLNYFNDLTPEWAPTTLALANEVKTPYLIYLCEDTQIKASKEKIHACINEFIELGGDYLLLTKLEKYLQNTYVEGYTPWSNVKSPGYKRVEHGYTYLGKHAPHKRLSTDAVYHTNWYKERVMEFIINGEACKHDIPIRDKRKPNFYEGYYDFANGMIRFGEMVCYIPDEPIITEFDEIKQNK